MGSNKSGKKKTKKGGTKKKERVEPPTEWDELPLEEIKNVVSKLESEQEEAAKERARAQAEHDAVLSYYNITRQKSQDVDLKIEEIERKIEEREREHATELRMYADKINHISYEHERRLREARKEADIVRNDERRKHEERIIELERRRKESRKELREWEEAAVAAVELAKEDFAKDLQLVREGLERDLAADRSRYDARLDEMKRSFKLASEEDLRELEKQADLHLTALENRHKEAFEDAKKYFNNAAKSGLDEIKKLRSELDRVKEEEERSHAKIEHLKYDTDRLSGPLKEKLEEVAKLKHEIRNKEKDQMTLKNTRARIVATKDQLNKQTEKYNLMKSKYEEVEKERNELKKIWLASQCERKK